MQNNQPRFEGVDFCDHEVYELNPDSENLGQGFKCIRNEFATYVKKGKIKNECKTFTSKCWTITHDGHLAGYITLMADKLSVETKLLEGEGVNYKTFPAVKIGWLAADKRARRAGKRLIEWAIEYTATDLVNRLGVRFLTVDALYDIDERGEVIYDASKYYLKFGFCFTNSEEVISAKKNFRSMYFDLKVIIDVLRNSQ